MALVTSRFSLLPQHQQEGNGASYFPYCSITVNLEVMVPSSMGPQKVPGPAWGGG